MSGPARSSPATQWLPLVVALAAGALLTLAFAPFNVWPLAIVCPALLMILWQGTTARRGAALGFSFGVGAFSAGTWWLYISIHVFGPQPIWISVAAVAMFVVALAGYYALLGWAASRFLPAAGPWRWYAGLPSLWLLIECLRGSFQLGYPWLSLGYSQTDTWLAGYAPVLGVYGVSALLLLQAGALCVAWERRAVPRSGRVPLLLVAVIWAAGWALGRVEWTLAAGAPVSVAIVQGAIPQDEKWQVDNRLPIRALYRDLDDQALGARLIVWPEAAIPELANEIPRYLADIQASARSHGGDVVMGVVRKDDNGVDYYNSIMALTGGVAFYDKRHLVPFVETFPVPALVRDWLQLLKLPYSSFAFGKEGQAPLQAGGMSLAPTICFEDSFGAAQLALAARSTLLVNVTNDAWFGHSQARYQHLQIGRMRALEVGRSLVRAGNDGISAIVGPKGELIAMAPEYQRTVLRGTVVPRNGLSPYTRVGNWPVLLLAFGAAAAAGFRRRFKSLC